MLVQQVDFLETILEETSDDLQSDSDRSGTTYWVGSDSETESVIHIRANRLAGKEYTRDIKLRKACKFFLDLKFFRSKKKILRSLSIYN